MATICDSCYDAAYDEGMPDGEEFEILSAIGGEISDHLCDEIESDGDIECRCSCKLDLKRTSRKRKIAVSLDTDYSPPF